MDRVFFEGIRCFYSRQEVPLAPVTILVGENSSGKSTALALIRLAWDLAHPEAPLSFNEEPFLLGTHEQIASSLEGRERNRSFSIGWSTNCGSVNGYFGSLGGQSILSTWDCGAPPYSVQYLYGASGALKEIVARGPFGEERIGRLSRFKAPADDFFERFDQFIVTMGLRPFAFAPIRTRPQRTYDPIRKIESPEGAHIPLFLASTVSQKSWRKLSSALESFGQKSGLFAEIGVRQLGEGEGDPFQIQVYLSGEAVNLIDVGYGVSQVLPIVIECLRGDPERTYLLQQPEVHLHPRAQAELGSFLAVLAKQQNKRFVIETHSDYLVDRIRMDIRDKKGITPDDVALLYFERKNGEATINRLELDDQGNILNAPPGYRSFFLEEERRFLGG